MIQAPSDAPKFAHDLASSAQKALDAMPQMFISAAPFTVAELTPAMAALYPYKFALVSDGAANKHIAQSDGTVFRYLEGTAV